MTLLGCSICWGSGKDLLGNECVCQKYSKLASYTPLVPNIFEPKPIKVSTEILYHYSCGTCSKWWSVGDHQESNNEHMTCPHCGVRAKIIKE